MGNLLIVTLRYVIAVSCGALVMAGVHPGYVSTPLAGIVAFWLVSGVIAPRRRAGRARKG